MTAHHFRLYVTRHLATAASRAALLVDLASQSHVALLQIRQHSGVEIVRIDVRTGYPYDARVLFRFEVDAPAGIQRGVLTRRIARRDCLVVVALKFLVDGRKNV